MIDYEKLTVVLDNNIEFKSIDIAKLFCDLDGDQMAEFFTEVKRISDTWMGSFVMQMQYVKDSNASTDDGRSIMRTIGEYA